MCFKSFKEQKINLKQLRILKILSTSCQGKTCMKYDQYLWKREKKRVLLK